MPFSKDPGPRESDKYCSYCFKNGKLCYEGADLKEFQKHCYEGMVQKGMNRFVARCFAWMVRFAPRWKKTKK
jgi:Putative zinc ribbon domain